MLCILFTVAMDIVDEEPVKRKITVIAEELNAAIR